MSEETLFDSGGKPIAYIDHADEATIYSFAGKPLAYLGGDNIFGFNGKHLGWLRWSSGITLVASGFQSSKVAYIHTVRTL